MYFFSIKVKCQNLNLKHIMASEIFSVSWNDFQSKLSSSFKILRNEEDFFNVTLVSDDEECEFVITSSNILKTLGGKVLKDCEDFQSIVYKKHE